MTKKILEEIRYYAGYPENDSMREKAERLFHEEARENPRSASAPDRTPMRLYKKGGHVSHPRAHMAKMGHKMHEAAERKRSKLHHQEEKALHHALKDISKERHLRSGGYAKSEGEMMPRLNKGGRTKDIMGGSLTDLYIPKKIKSMRTPKLAIQTMREAEKMRHGGKVHKASGGHIKKTMYERDMLGDHPSRKRPHINYEDDMRGEICEGRPSMKKYKNPGAVDASEGQYKKRGGHVRYAAGGAAKVRHGVATASGRPITRKVNRSK